MNKMSYYTSNAVYKLLESQASHPFVWAAGNAWMLIYGDKTGTPKALVMASGKSWIPQKEILETVEKIAQRSDLPLFFINFDDESESIEKIKLGRPGTNQTELSLDDLKDKFRKFGLQVSSGLCQKSVNDATSSAYHKWQRSLGSAITVTDIDLVRLNSAGDPIEAIELKRSYISLQNWTPFRNDFPNFNLLLSVCKMAEMKMIIAYNVRHKQPVFKDDASQLSLFSYQARDVPEKIGYFSFSDFLTANNNTTNTM